MVDGIAGTGFTDATITNMTIANAEGRTRLVP